MYKRQVRIEVGPRDVDNGAAMVSRRDKLHKDKESVAVAAIGPKVSQVLEEIQQTLYREASAYRNAHIREDIETLEELRAFFGGSSEGQEAEGGFVLAKWCGEPGSESLLDDLKVTIRCLPLKQRNTTGRCIFTGKPATTDVILAKSY